MLMPHPGRGRKPILQMPGIDEIDGTARLVPP
jgi:hypothetical protein